MIKTTSLLRPILLACLFYGDFADSLRAQTSAGDQPPVRTQSAATVAPTATSRVVDSANAFLATLDEKQKAKALFAFDDKEQRVRWSNFPTQVVPRGGVNLYELNEAQRTAAMALMASVLSQRGLEKVQQIREADEAFKTTDHGPRGRSGPPFGNARDHGPGGPPPSADKNHGPGGPPFGNEPGGDHGHPPSGEDKGSGPGGPPRGGFNLAAQGGSLFGRNLYYFSILGTPSETTPWMLQFGGHHLALNITMAGGRGALTPTLTGSQPATFTTADGKTVRPLGQENDKGFALLNALDASQRGQAILKYRVADLVLGPGEDGKTILPEGLKASAMSEPQRAMLLDLIAEWAGIINDAHAATRLSEIKDGLENTYFAWSGPTTHADGKKRVGLLPHPGTETRHRVLAAGCGRRPDDARPYNVPRSYQRIRTRVRHPHPMKVRLALFAVAFLWWVAPAHAHRLDEYLQATTIALEEGHVVLQLRLTPGVAVAGQVLASLDDNGDGTISDAEQQAQAERVRRDLSLAVDGRAVPLRLVSSTFPSADEITSGVGDILLTFEADVPVGGAATHRLTFENHHQNAIAVYLVNCLLPRAPGVHVVAQDRSYDQARYQLDFSSGDAPALAPAISAPPRPPQTTDPPVFGTFLWHGVHHILTGYDHLLFVGALVLAATTLWDLIKVITAFTLAHSLTLTLAALNLVHVSGRVVEPLISASIVCVALQNIFWPEHSRGWNRLALAFFFGLFHGLGFAGGLLDVMHQMQKETVLVAILGFSVGVEAGHQAVLLPLFAALKAARRIPIDAANHIRLAPALRRLGSAGISVAGVYYLCMALTGHP